MKFTVAVTVGHVLQLVLGPERREQIMQVYVQAYSWHTGM